MNKNLIIAIVVILVLILGVGGFLMLSKKNVTAPETTSTKTSTQNPIASFQDALAKGVSLSCSFTTESGVKVMAYTKGGMVRSDISGKTPQETGSMIMRDKKIYYWNAESGFMMDVPDITVTPSAASSTSSSATSTLDSIKQYWQSCKPAVVSDSIFEIPTNVKFQDMSKMVPSGAMMRPSGAVPSGTQAYPSGMTQQQIQEMMKKYQQPSQ